jgi:hypothetical protein
MLSSPFPVSASRGPEIPGIWSYFASVHLIVKTFVAGT